MLIAYKTEIHPTEKQKAIIKQTIGVTRATKNQYIAHVSEVYQNGGSFVSAIDYSKWLNNTYLPTHPEKSWVKEVYAKAVKQGLMNTQNAFQRFFKGLGKYPKFKKKNRQDVSFYFVKNDAKHIIACQRHRIKIPTLSWVKLKEKGYIPSHSETSVIKSGTISIKANRYYVSVLVEVPDTYKKTLPNKENEGVGYDLGIKDTAIGSNKLVYKNINKSGRIRKLEKKLKRQQRQLSRKYESEKLRIKNKEITKGDATRKNIDKQVLKVQKLHQQLTNIREDFQNKMVHDMAKTKPAYITIEDLNIKGMMKNKHLSKAIAQQKLHGLKTKLISKANQGYFELRQVDRFYPSSKLCNHCGNKKIDLKLSDRTYECEKCGYQEDRDFNASLNLKDATKYIVLAPA
ncbi:MAG: transposase [Streptococcaceae bacterium]|nr:transposase [Streptococcaceae bacterium]